MQGYCTLYGHIFTSSTSQGTNNSARFEAAAEHNVRKRKLDLKN